MECIWNQVYHMIDCEKLLFKCRQRSWLSYHWVGCSVFSWIFGVVKSTANTTANVQWAHCMQLVYRKKKTFLLSGRKMESDLVTNSKQCRCIHYIIHTYTLTPPNACRPPLNNFIHLYASGQQIIIICVVKSIWNDRIENSHGSAYIKKKKKNKGDAKRKCVV